MTKPKEALAIQEGTKTKRPRLKKSDGPNSTASKKTDGSNSTPSENNLIGQEVHGTVDGSFDCGYLLTVKVGALPLLLRGLVFEPTLAVPLSNDNDIAPNVKPQVRDDKISIPMPVPPVSEVNELAQPLSEVNGLAQVSNVNTMHPSDQNIAPNVNTNVLVQVSNVNTMDSNAQNIAPNVNSNGLAQSDPCANDLTQPVSDVNGFCQVSNIQTIASNVNPVASEIGTPSQNDEASLHVSEHPNGVLISSNTVSYNDNAPSGNGSAQLNVVDVAQNNIVSSENANAHVKPDNAKFMQTANMNYTLNVAEESNQQSVHAATNCAEQSNQQSLHAVTNFAEQPNQQSANAATNFAEQSNQHGVDAATNFVEESDQRNMDFDTNGVEQSNQQSSDCTTNFAEQSNQHDINYATNVVEQSSQQNVNFVEQSNQQSMDVATDFIAQPNQQNINYSSNVVDQSSQQNMKAAISCADRSKNQNMFAATNFADHSNHQNMSAPTNFADQPSQQNTNGATNFAYQSNEQNMNAAIDFADQSNEQNMNAITSVAEQSDQQRFPIAEVIPHTLSSNATKTLHDVDSGQEQSQKNAPGEHHSFLPGNAGGPSLDGRSISASHRVFMDVKQGTVNVVDEGQGAEDLMAFQHMVEDMNHDQANGHNGRSHVQDGMMGLHQTSSVEDLVASSQDQVAIQIPNMVNHDTERSNGNLDPLLINECSKKEEMETGIPNTAFDIGHGKESVMIPNAVPSMNSACFLDVQEAELMDYQLENGENMVANTPQPIVNTYVSDTTGHLHTEAG